MFYRITSINNAFPPILIHSLKLKEKQFRIIFRDKYRKNILSFNRDEIELEVSTNLNGFHVRHYETCGHLFDKVYNMIDLRNRNKLQTVKYVKQNTDEGLRNAKEFVDDIWEMKESKRYYFLGLDKKIRYEKRQNWETLNKYAV